MTEESFILKGERLELQIGVADWSCRLELQIGVVREMESWWRSGRIVLISFVLPQAVPSYL
jgi:hypothetical protein